METCLRQLRFAPESTPFLFAGKAPACAPHSAKRPFEGLRSGDSFTARKREKGFQSEVRACGLTSLDAWFGRGNLPTRKRYKITARFISADRHGFHLAQDFTGLMKTIDSPLDSDLSGPQQLPARLFEREALVFSTSAKGRRALDFMLEPSFPSSIESIRHGLDRL